MKLGFGLKLTLPESGHFGRNFESTATTCCRVAGQGRREAGGRRRPALGRSRTPPRLPSLSTDATTILRREQKKRRGERRSPPLPVDRRGGERGKTTGAHTLVGGKGRRGRRSPEMAGNGRILRLKARVFATFDRLFHLFPFRFAFRRRRKS
jgi:hypothetical protein